MYLRGENMNGFGKRLIEARERKGYNQKQFAEILGITPTRLNYWEKDKREPDFFMFSKIITLLEEDANKLLGIQLHADEGIQMYNQLDDIDQAEIRGEMRHMLKASKYNNNETAEKQPERKPFSRHTVSSDDTSDNTKRKPFSGPRPARIAAYGHEVTGVESSNNKK